jgi:hypothetical protein
MDVVWVWLDSIDSDNRIAFDFFGNIQLIYSFIEVSSSGHGILEKIANRINIKPKKSLSITRCVCRAED